MDILDRTLRDVIDLAQRAPEAREWNAVPDEEGIGSLPPLDTQMLVFLNGHVQVQDTVGRDGGGWGIRIGYFDHDKRRWRVQGSYENFVTHWMPFPLPPGTAREK